MSTKDYSRGVSKSGIRANHDKSSSTQASEDSYSSDTYPQDAYPEDGLTLLGYIQNSAIPPSNALVADADAALTILREQTRFHDTSELTTDSLTAISHGKGVRRCSLLGDVIRDKRKQAQIRRDALSRQTNIDYEWLMLLENGLIPVHEIRRDYLQAIATALNIPLIALELLSQADDSNVRKSLREIEAE